MILARMETISIFDWLEKSKKTILVSGSSKVKSHYRTIEVSDEIDEQKNKTKNNKYEQIRRISNDIIRKQKRIIRLDERGEQGRLDGGRTAIEATCLLGECQSAEPEMYREQKEAFDPDLEDRLQAIEEKLLIDYAKSERKWFNYETIKKNAGEQLQSGAEAAVFVYSNEDGSKYVIKTIDYTVYSGLPSEFIDNRIALYNSLFPETRYELLGFTKRINSDSFSRKATFNFVIKQPYIDGHELLEEYDNTSEKRKELLNEIEETLNKRFEFKRQDIKTYFNDRCIIEDVHLANVFRQNKTNNLYFIDVSPSLNTPNEGFGGKNHYREFDIVDNELKKSETVTIFEYLRIKRKL